jgi:asparagine synthase (glutamine-hydrolysing)
MLYALCYFIGNPEEIMSGIAGIYYLDGRPVETTDVVRMVDSIAHRGPDGSGVWTDGSIGLGHRMLWTTPESLHEKLPLTNKTGDLTITADARIDNRDELIPTLNFNGRPRETIADSEIILAAYEKWGEKCPEKLLGDFSFAIWDKRKQIVFCARDPIGIKPFYYYFNGKTFRWSSEPKAIFEDNTIPKEPNLPLICLYLLNRFDEREETLYKNVYRLPPSHFMVLENGKLRKGQYWDIDPNRMIRYKTDAEYAEHFLSLFKEAVKVRLRSHGPVGALLSGGLDSSSIVCTAQSLYKEGIIPDNGFETFSIVFDKFPCDERLYINEVTNKWKVKASYYFYERDLSWLDFEEIKKYSDVAYLPTLLSGGPILREAQKRGIRIMLDGDGGDDYFAIDFDHLTDLMLEVKIKRLISQLWYDAKYSSHYSLGYLTLNYCIKPLIPQYIKKYLKQILKPFRGNGIPSWINESFLKKTGVNERLSPIVSSIKFPTRSLQRIYDMSVHSRGKNVLLEILERFSTHFGVENRYPFLGKRMVEFLFAVPENQRWHGKWTKAVLREAMVGILPESIRCRRGKADFSPIIDMELKERQTNKTEQLIKTSILSTLGLVHINRFYQLFNDYQRGKGSYKIRQTLEIFIWLELWYRSQWSHL